MICIKVKGLFRALFFLRNIRCDRSVGWISKGFADPSALLKVVDLMAMNVLI